MSDRKSTRFLSSNYTPNPERKLLAAKFFLERLLKCDDDPYAIYHFASAVLVNGRSVFQALVHEYTKKDENKKNVIWAWYNRQLEQLPDDESLLLKNMKKLRNKDVHEVGLLLDMMVDVRMAKGGGWFDGHFGSTGVRRTEAAEVWDFLQEIKRAPPEIFKVVRYKFKELGPEYQSCGGQDVIDTCGKFVDLTDYLLREARKHFPHRGTTH